MTRARIRLAIRLAAITVAMAGLAVAAPARAQDGAVDDSLRNWKLGALDYSGNLRAADQLQDLHQQKFRIGGSLLPWLEPYATLKPWVASQPSLDGSLHGVGGVLADVPLGAFVFTPSVGAGSFTPAPRVADGGGGIQFRTQLELGYQFDNLSRVALGYSRITTAGSPDPRADGNVIGFTFRMPFGALLGQ